VEVNEEGTEAAAATGVIMKRAAAIPGKGPFQMIVDHPFLFLIEDTSSHTILFLGEVLDPMAG
jgi:serpin B